MKKYYKTKLDVIEHETDRIIETVNINQLPKKWQRLIKHGKDIHLYRSKYDSPNTIRATSYHWDTMRICKIDR